jgi:hypothetical protein
MKINKFFKNFSFISKEYKFFAFLISASICCAYGIFILISYQNHRNTYNQKYSSLGLAVANSYEVFLDNIFRQAEFVGQKIEESDDKNSINKLLKHSFSLDVNLDTSLLSSWIKFEWISKNNPKIDDYDLITSKKEPWLIHFGSLHSNSLDPKDHFIPVSFGVTDGNSKFIGILVSNISISAITKFLQRNIQEDTLNILILDRDQNVIGQSINSKIDLPRDFFKNQKFSSSEGNIYQKFDLTNIAYISYKKLDSYPFTIVIGDNKKIIFQPLQSTLIKYFIVLVLVLIVLLAILLLFYRKIITPVVSLSSFAKNIISSEEKVTYTPEGHSFVEISHLEQALIKIEGYKNELNDSNKELNRKTIELEITKKNLEEDLKKLSDSYRLRDNLLKKSLEKTNKVAAKDVVEQCLSVLYPEIYSRQLNIIKSLSDTPELNIKHCDFVKIVTGLLSRSFMFSSKNNQISVQTKVKTMNETKHFYLTVEDNGLGSEEWRIKSLNNCSEFKEMELMIKESGGILKCVNKPESGVKYYILLPYEEKEPTQDLRKSDKIIFFPSNNFKK